MSTRQQQDDPGATSSWWDAVTFAVTDLVPGERPPHQVSGGFAMSKDEMRQLLADAKTLRTLIAKQGKAAEPLRGIAAPGQDPASLKYTDAANKTGSNYVGHLGLQGEYLDKLIEKLSKALGVTTGHDRNASDALRKIGQGL
ncbi:hypothetical protein [Amycolatopsis anabasis]|uniref:hypothetical protein n=1 Tax=Amycolatopsis anabasis TaxID=1840409 RepID=UPI00131C5ACC|nr:hypothetical protein [Amycolatopsis anabasis]